jgi:hypothetical protein
MKEQRYDYEPYILNENNMQSYLKYKLTSDRDKDKNINRDKTTFINSMEKNSKTNISVKPVLFIPKEQDTLFWCYYIILNGEGIYEMLNVKNSLIAKQMKINYVSKIRENKQIIKTHKFDSITSIENNLANDNNISIKTIMSLCAIDKTNVIFVSRKSYFELLMNDTGPIYIIREVEFQSKYNKKYGFEIANINSLEIIRTTLYKIDNLDKPIKSLSSYKVKDLTDICVKLGIGITNPETGKQMTKNELYETIIQYF